MKNSASVVVTIFSLVMAVGVTNAAEKPDKPLAAAVEFGFLFSNGNSDTQSLNARLNASYDLKDWRYQGSLQGLSAATADPTLPGSELVTSAERYALDLQLDRKLVNNHSMFVKTNYDEDRFSGFDYQAGLGIGYGRQLVKTDTRDLRVELGPGFRVSKPDIGESEDEATLSTALLLKQAIAGTSSFNQFLYVEAGKERAITTSETSVSAQIYGQLAMKLALNIKHNSNPALDVNAVEKASVDKVIAVNLVYSF